MGSPYSTLKAAWHLDRILDIREGRPVVPIELQLILSDHCNHDCHFCAYRASNGLSQERFVEYEDGVRNHNPVRMIPEYKAREIIEDAAVLGIKSVIFTGGGEPTVHPNHLELFDLALSKGLDCSLNTNGVIFRKGWEQVLPKFKYVRFSIDAGTPAEYAKVRGCPESHYQRALGHMRELREQVDKQGTECVVGAGYVVTPENYPNIHTGVANIYRARAHYVRLAAMQSTDDKAAYGEHWWQARKYAMSCGELETDDFKVYDLMEGVVGERPDYEFCGFQHIVLYVGANLEVYRCCYTAYTDLGLVGSLHDKRLAEYLGKRDLTFDARSCRVCPLNEKNRVIGYLVDREPTHVNFV